MHREVLIVDDEEIVVFIHDYMIKKSGLANKTLNFSNGLEALTYLNETCPLDHSYIIFLDLNMPGMNGWQLLSALEKVDYKYKIEVILVSSSIDPYDLKKSKVFPMVKAFLPKPLSMEVCLELRQVLNRDAVVAPLVQNKTNERA